jgi:pyruvate dehydrogenase E2 component (dihydrolipoamide acetyltransferase)
MAVEITMPKLSDTMTEGLFACWKKKVGDRIERGDIIAEVETDKAVMELEAFASGILIQTMVQGGENVTVGTVLGLIGQADELTAPIISRSVSAAPEVRATTPVEEPKVTPAPVASTDTPHHPDAGHDKASPLVRRLAREEGIDLEDVTGSGPGGRITQEDLAAFITIRHQTEPPPVPPSSSEAVVPAPEASPVRTGLPPLRQAVADTVTRSWQSIPHFSASVEIDMSACREIVRELQDRPAPVGYNALVIKACAAALLKFPRLSPTTQTAASGEINICCAVALPDGVMMPVIRDCRRLSVAMIEAELSRLAEKCRSGRLTSEEMAGGAFSVSNLGMYGVDRFNALIVPGQVAILAVGEIRERAVVRIGQPAVAPTLWATLTSDHRTVDGACAASFLAELRAILEKPVALLM